MARLGGLFCASLNAADEVAVQAFLDQQLNFGDIPAVIEMVMGRVKGGAMTGLDAVLDAVTAGNIYVAARWARQQERAERPLVNS